jgi:hypothetical protein
MKLYFTTIKINDKEGQVCDGYKSMSEIIGDTSKYLLDEIDILNEEIKFNVSAYDYDNDNNVINEESIEKICTITITKPE